MDSVCFDRILTHLTEKEA